ncbi:MAG: hypothetical protein DRP00_05400 [Candidatus Aenigmatarchaeota archaeon]|nr:MAG: hypothetical protein DRP00_05400 [Candidatus Aenigmarchaeota archaeon]
MESPTFNENGYCAIGRGEDRCLLTEEIKTLVETVNKLSPINEPRIKGEVSADQLLSFLLRETNCSTEECMICELVRRAKDTPYESTVELIKEIAFKPEGPYDLSAFLDNFLLTRIGFQIQYNYEGVRFGGVLSYDFMVPPTTSIYGSPREVWESYSSLKGTNEEWDRLQFILNTDHRMGYGEHWVALVVSVWEGIIQYYDSYGDPPITGWIQSTRPYPGITDEKGRYISRLWEWIEAVQAEFIQRGIPLRFVYNEYQQQSSTDKVSCGVYSILSLILNANRVSFESANRRKITRADIERVRPSLYKRIHNYVARYPEVFE